MGSDYEVEFATAIAASAFAIHSIQEVSSDHRKKLMRDGNETHVSRLKTRKDQDPYKPSVQSNTVSSRFNGKEAEDSASVRRRLETQRRESHSSGQLPGDQRQRGSSTRRRSLEAKAEAWEKAALAKIRKRYEKIDSSILAWEKERKMEAKMKIERKKSELEMRKGLNLQHYNKKLARIDQIVVGARAQAEEKRRNAEYEVKERAKRIRSTGKAPFRCLCF
ncbi:hypothetical protein NMG60_11009659 [Bertholletia excelsa]